MNLLFRTDAHIAMGTGHVMRCLALAQAWQDAGGRATFAMADSTPALQERLRAENCEVRLLKAELGSVADAAETGGVARACGAGWVVVDGYHFGAEYQGALREAGCKVLFIDDNGHAGFYSADLVLNQNVYASEDLYQHREAQTRLLLGTKYALLRREFGAWKDWQRVIPERARRVLVTMGGSDPDNITARVLRSVLSQSEAVATVVLGGSNPRLDGLRDAARPFADRAVVLENVQNMAALIAEADVAVSGAGTTTLEMCYLGLPALLTVLAENQERVAEELSNRGVALNLGEGTRLDLGRLEKCLAEVMESAEMRTAMSARGRKLVDGLGAKRVVRAIRPLALRIRRAQDADCRRLWELANDPGVRASAFSPAPIPWERHVEWFRDRIQAKRCHMLVGEADGAMVGQVRVDECADREGEVDVSVAREFRGEGLGSRLIDLAVREIFASTTVLRIHAFVLPENEASQHAFTRAGFERAGEQEVKGHRALHYVRSRSDQPYAQNGASAYMTTRATQAELLEQRIAENRASQEVDLVSWIFERVSVSPGQVLELCCGTGGQTLRLLREVGEQGRVIAVDVSAEALATLNERAGADRGRLSTVQGNLDNLHGFLGARGLVSPAFDLVFCAYGLYYSADARKTLEEARSWLKPGGQIVVVGPFGPNNGPLFDMVRTAGVAIPDPVIESSERFMTETVVPWAAVNFKSLRIHTLVNTVRWATAERVLNYWQNTTFYSAAHRAEFERLLAEHFARRGEFANQKWVMMVEMADARS